VEQAARQKSMKAPLDTALLLLRAPALAEVKSTMDSGSPVLQVKKDPKATGKHL
jgi:hypothetical protein